jgi:hypothetical protein
LGAIGSIGAVWTEESGAANPLELPIGEGYSLEQPRLNCLAMTYRQRLFVMSLGLTLGVWVIRGFGFLTMIPGLLQWVLLGFSILTGLLAAFRPRRWS